VGRALCEFDFGEHNCAWLTQYLHEVLAGASMYACTYPPILRQWTAKVDRPCPRRFERLAAHLLTCAIYSCTSFSTRTNFLKPWNGLRPRTAATTNYMRLLAGLLGGGNLCTVVARLNRVGDWVAINDQDREDN
jgi:hypothetical protein